MLKEGEFEEKEETSYDQRTRKERNEPPADLGIPITKERKKNINAQQMQEKGKGMARIKRRMG